MKSIKKGVKNKKNLNKKIIIILIVVFLLIFTALNLLPVFRVPFTLKINDVTKKKLDNAWYDFYKQDYKKAISEFDEIAASNPRAPHGYYGLAASYYQLEDYENAVKYYTKLANLIGDDPNIYRTLAGAYHMLAYETDGDYSNAAKYIQKSLELNSNDTIALNIAGDIYRETMNHDKMWYYYNKSLSINNTNPYTLADVGVAYWHEKDFDTAIKYLTKSIEQNPYNKLVGQALQDSYYLKGDYDKVIEVGNSLINYTPNYYWYYYEIGLSYIFKNESDKAIFYLKKAVELTPQTLLYRVAYSNAALGLAYLQNKEYDKSINSFQTALNNGNIPIAYGGLSAAYYFLNEDVKSERFLRLFFNFDIPTEMGVNRYLYSKQLNLLSILYINNKAYDRAVRHLEIALELDPGNKESKELLNEIKSLQKNET